MARFAILWEKDYDEVCYVDADILPSKNVLGKSIFDWEGVAKKTEREDGSRMEWHVNAGVFKLTQQEAMKMRKYACLLYTSTSPRDRTRSRMPSSA